MSAAIEEPNARLQRHQTTRQRSMGFTMMLTRGLVSDYKPLLGVNPNDKFKVRIRTEGVTVRCSVADVLALAN
jgi:hypothetical protein